MQFGIVPFSQPKEFFFQAIDFRNSLLPECHGNFMSSMINPKPVNASFSDPVFHSIDHFRPKPFIVIVQERNIGPVSFISDSPGRILGIKFGMLLHPRVVPGRMVWYPVNYQLHIPVMSRFYQLLKVLFGSEIRIYGFIIPDGIVATQFPFPLFFTDGVNGHQPKYFHAHRIQPWQVLLESLEGAFRSILPDIYLVNIGVPGPFRMGAPITITYRRWLRLPATVYQR